MLIEMWTRRDYLMYDALSQMLSHMGNDPRVFGLYFTCKTFYQLFVRVSFPIYGGFDKFKNYGCDWTVPLEDMKYKGHLQTFYRENFKGHLVCDFEPLYAYLCVYDFGYFRVPLNIVKFFYILKYDGLKNIDDISLYVFKKNASLLGKSNIVSLNESNVITNSDSIEARMNLVVNDNYVVHDDSFIVGIKISTFGVVLTSQFCIGKINFFGVSCYASFKMWLNTIRSTNMRFLKCSFSYYPFFRKIMAMYQCKRCNKILKRFFKYFFKNQTKYQNMTNFEIFGTKMLYNSKRRPKFVNMNFPFTSKYGYSDASKLPGVFDHMYNGELIHDCYYDLLDSDRKILFIEDMNFMKPDEYGCWKLACPALLTEICDFNIDSRLNDINLNRENRNYFYADSVKRTFAYFAIF